MTAQDMIEAARLTRVRELQTQLAKAAAENARLATENAELNAHLDLAILAAEDLRALPEGGKLVIVDGWNVILGAVPCRAAAREARAVRENSVVRLPTGAPEPFAVCEENRKAKNPRDLIAEAKAYLAEHPLDFVWIVFDGPRENARVEGRLRISYTGGIGQHRADKFICDFLRMAKFRGLLDRISVESRDKDFQKDIKRLKAD